jgi:hypothetical protein
VTLCQENGVGFLHVFHACYTGHGLTLSSMIQSPHFHDEDVEGKRGIQETKAWHCHSDYLVSSTSAGSSAEVAAPVGKTQTKFSCSHSF